MSLVTAPSNWFQMLMTSLWNNKCVIRDDGLKHLFRNLRVFFSSSIH